MRIGILVLMAGRSAGGPETYEVELLRGLAEQDCENEYVIYCTGRSAVDAIGVKKPNFVFRVLAPSFRPISLSVSFPALLIKDGLDFFHATFTPPLLHARDLFLTVHCLSSMEHPEWYRPATAWRLNFLLRSGIRKAKMIACVSHSTLEQVHEQFGIPKARMVVTYNGVSRRFAPSRPEETQKSVRETFGLAEPYILYVGKLQAHKNVVGLIEAYDRFRKATGSRTRLVIVGAQAAGYTGVDEILRRLNPPDVVRLGYVSDDNLPVLYRAARMFVFPSFWEGFGLPVVEAMASGTPVVTSNVTCLPEIGGDAALLVDPSDVESIAEMIERLDSSASLRETLIKRGLERARLFTWEDCARSTLDGYRRMRGC